MMLAACLAALAFPPSWSAQAVSGADSSSLRRGRPGPAESLYLQLSSTELDPGRVFDVRGASLDRSAIHITLEDGTIAFTKDVLGRITGAFFEGDGEVLLVPPNEVERKSMSLFTGMAILEERFSTAYFRFNDNTAAELQPGLRAPEQAEQFVARWGETARNLAQADAMRLLASFSEMLPIAGGTISKDSPATRAADPTIACCTLGCKEANSASSTFSSTRPPANKSRQDKPRPAKTELCITTSGPHSRPRIRGGARGSETNLHRPLPAETESREDPILVRSYEIDAQVKPPKELDAKVKLQLDVVRGGSRFLVFELSRFLQIQTVEADGKAVEFIQNPAVEGTRLARSGNDLVAVILPEPARKGQKINLRFVYGGEVLAEAGKGLLYVGARGTWYPNRGMAMADFDLTFHYPPGWTLVATGKPAPLSAPSTNPSQTAPQNGGDEQMAHWVSERPIPVAGFNLGKYVRGTAQAGNVLVETYATGGVERDFPSPPSPTLQIDPTSPSRLQPPPTLVAPLKPSPARNATSVAEVTARAIRYYAERFGPFPYSQLALTQLPGRESQGWPGLDLPVLLCFPGSRRARRSPHECCRGIGWTSRSQRTKPHTSGGET